MSDDEIKDFDAALDEAIKLYNEFGMMSDDEGFSMSEILYEAARRYRRKVDIMKSRQNMQVAHAELKVYREGFNDCLEFISERYDVIERG